MLAERRGRHGDMVRAVGVPIALRDVRKSGAPWRAKSAFLFVSEKVGDAQTAAEKNEKLSWIIERQHKVRNSRNQSPKVPYRVAFDFSSSVVIRHVFGEQA